MALKPPQNAFSRAQAAEAKSSLEGEVAAEKAAALGRAGRGLEQALAALSKPDPGTDRETLLLIAAERTQAYFMQRELNGLRDQAEIIREYGIPREVLVRIGVRRKR